MYVSQILTYLTQATNMKTIIFLIHKDNMFLSISQEFKNSFFILVACFLVLIHAVLVNVDT